MRSQGNLLKVMIVLGLVASLSVNAQSPFDWQQGADGRPFVSAQSAPQEVSRTSSPYSSTIYAVGSDEMPSAAYDPSSEGQQHSNKPGIRKGHGDDNISGPEYGQTDYSPVGEPFVLFAFALLFAAAIAYRRISTKNC